MGGNRGTQLWALGGVLILSLVFLIWRSWRDAKTSAEEQRALFQVGVHTILVPYLLFVASWAFPLSLGALFGMAALLGTLSGLAVKRFHGSVLGNGGLYRRVRNLTFYYAFLTALLLRFSLLHVVLTWYLKQPSWAHTLLIVVALAPGVLVLFLARPAAEEWKRWWAVRQWSALFLVFGLLAWSAATGQS